MPQSSDTSLLSFRTNACAWCVLLALATLSGCGEASHTVPVHGQVSYQGEAIEKGTVTFFPTQGRPVIASLAAGGAYRAELEPGDYTVVVNVSSEIPEGYQEGDPLPRPSVELPAKYTTRVRSQLNATVHPGQSEPIDFSLE